MLRGLEAVTDKATAASPYIGIVVYASKFKVLINIKVNNEQCAAPVRAVSCGAFCWAQKNDERGRSPAGTPRRNV